MVLRNTKHTALATALTIALILAVLGIGIKTRFSHVYLISIFLFVIIPSFAIIVVILLRKKEKEKEKKKKTNEQMKNEVNTSIDNIKQYDDIIDTDTLIDEIKGTCIIKPNENGECKDGTKLKGECCETIQKTQKEVLTELAAQLIAQVAISNAIEDLLIKQLAKGSDSRAAKMAKEVGKKGRKLMSKVGGKTGAKLGAKLASKKLAAKAMARGVMMVGKIAVKMVTKVAVASAKACVPFLGWAGLFLDITLNAIDFSGYNLDLSYYTLLMLRNDALWEYKKNALKPEGEGAIPTKPENYPAIFNIFDDGMPEVGWPGSYKVQLVSTYSNLELYKYMTEQYIIKNISEFIDFIRNSKHAGSDQFATELVDYLISDDEEGLTDDEEEKLMEKLDYYQKRFMNKTAVKRDRFIYDNLIFMIENDPSGGNIEDRKKRIAIYPELSGEYPHRMAVSLSKYGCDHYNELNRKKIMAGFDYFNPGDGFDQPALLIPFVTDEIDDPLDTASKVWDQDIFKVEIRDTKKVKLGATGCFAYPFANLWNFCESKKVGGAKLSKSKNAGEGILKVISGQTSVGTIDPYKDGVRFDLTSFKCVYSRKYCEDTMAIAYDDDKNACFLGAGQALIELIIPKELVRAVGKTGQGIAKGFGYTCPNAPSYKVDETNATLSSRGEVGGGFITDGQCCRNVMDCNDGVKSCPHCKYGHVESCTGGYAEGETPPDGKGCGSMRRCITEEEWTSRQINNTWGGQCWVEGTEKAMLGIVKGFGYSCPTAPHVAVNGGSGALNSDRREGGGSIRDGQCCMNVMDCNDGVKSCPHCKYGHVESCTAVGSHRYADGETPPDGKWCSSTRRCITEEEWNSGAVNVTWGGICYAEGAANVVNDVNNAVNETANDVSNTYNETIDHVKNFGQDISDATAHLVGWF